jgi:hypothetical protein
MIASRFGEWAPGRDRSERKLTHSYFNGLRSIRGGEPEDRRNVTSLSVSIAWLRRFDSVWLLQKSLADEDIDPAIAERLYQTRAIRRVTEGLRKR